MPFDRDACRRFVRTARDRDRSLWFAGRDTEIGEIEAAIVDSKDSRQAVFRVVQGAPGAGKTALVSHMMERAPESRLYVPLRHEDLVSSETVDARVELALRERDPAWARAARWALQSAGRTFRAGDAGDEAAGALRSQLVENLELVLVLDEAHAVKENAHTTILDLHAAGFGRPCVLLLCGLSHSADVIGAIDGVSRPADNATVNLTILSEDECAASTRMMFDKLGVEAESDAAACAAERATAWSKGWPQHLHGAQQALAAQLLDHDGDLTRVDFVRAEAMSDQKRYDYYGKRLESDDLLRDVPFTARITAAVGRLEKPPTFGEIIDVCEATLGSGALPGNIRAAQADKANVALAAELTNKLIGKGVLARNGATRYEIAIPSMADWLQTQGFSNTPAA